ncbi:hypothetical protein J6590_030378 [Homalodisca vitripennis]|nr:hypothetical protein J6590_030378 [Homalodisca vitripennis]
MELELLTLPRLYVLETIMFCRLKCQLVQGRDVHEYDSRTKKKTIVSQQMQQPHESLPSRTGIRRFFQRNCKTVSTISLAEGTVFVSFVDDLL